MKMKILIGLITGTAGLLAAGAGPLRAQVPGEYQEVLTHLGRTGDFKADVLKVNIPRSDLKMSVEGVALPTAFGFGGWVAMTKAEGGQDIMMGDLVLLQEEVNPVMSALLDQGIEVTALHNHFFWDEPRLFYMHIHGMGKPADLARRVKPGLDLIGKHVAAGQAAPGGSNETQQRSGPVPRPSAPEPLDVAELTRIVGREGDTMGAVHKFTIGREDIGLRDMGARVGARMGLNTWAAFFGSDKDAVVAGDIAMLESEVTPVLKSLRKHGLDVVAIHHHMIGVKPVVIFLHYWGKGPAALLARGFREALDVSANRAK